MKKLITITLALILATTAAIPAMAADYVFGGANSGNFGKPTSVEPVTVIGGPVDESANINRSKDSAFAPPAFGSPDSNTPGTGEPLTPNISGVSISYTSNNSPTVANNGGGSGTPYHPAESADIGAPPTMDVSYSAYDSQSSNKFTMPDGLFYTDGSMGTLSIPKLNLSVKVYEEESLENMKRGIGHFKSTSCWDGNAAFAGHNRGNSDYFGKIHTLSVGDKIVYTTKLGTRTYEVYSVKNIHETDVSVLQRSSDNIVTLITCVNDRPELRVCVQARQVN